MKRVITIKDAGEQWLRTCELNELERATLCSYRQHLDLHILPLLGEHSVDELSAGDIYEFIETLRDTLSQAMLRKVLGSLRALISEAVARGQVARNVAADVRLRNSRRSKEECIIPSKQEIRALLAACPDKYRAFLTVAVFTGMRASELRGLRWENVDFDRQIIQVRERVDRWNEFGMPKSRAGRRNIPMAPVVKEVLSDWVGRCPKRNLGLVFPNGAGNPETHSNLYNRFFLPLMVECGVVNKKGKPRFGMHALRHAAASLFIEQGWSPKKIQTLMGHASINMTFDVYGHLFDDMEGDIERMAKLEKDLMAA